MRKDVQAKTEQMEKSVRVSEREYSKKMADLNRGFEVCRIPISRRQYTITSFQTVGNSFTGMEARMNEVSSTAVRIGTFKLFLIALAELGLGEQLETVHIERQRAQAAYDLIDFYNQLSKGDTARLDTMRKEGRAGRRQVAVILRRLNTVAKEVDLPTADKVRLANIRYFRPFYRLYLRRRAKTSRNIARNSKKRCSISSIGAIEKETRK